MKVRITHLKAAWPEGAAVGSVVELEGDTIPAWALGKCQPVTGDGEAAGPQAAIAAAVKAATESLQAEVDALKATNAEQAALIAKLQGGKGEIVTNPGAGDDAGKGADGKASKATAKAQAAAG